MIEYCDCYNPSIPEADSAWQFKAEPLVVFSKIQAIDFVFFAPGMAAQGAFSDLQRLKMTH